MTGWKITYGILVLIALVAFVMPWMNAGGQSIAGWEMIIPFSFTYLIGLILAIIILFTSYKPVGLTIFAGILMLIGVIASGTVVGFIAGMSQAAQTAGGPEVGSGVGLAMLISLFYTILGPIAGNHFKKAHLVIETK